MTILDKIEGILDIQRFIPMREKVLDLQIYLILLRCHYWPIYFYLLGIIIISNKYLT